MPFYRVAREGKTVDNREITADQIKQMAANYDPEIYGARVWLEHCRGLFPDGPFNALGDVVALKTEKDKTGRLCLLADIKPTAELVKMNQDKQKIYTSIELEPTFSDTGEAYLTGLAVTDSPASTGTEALMFNARSKEPSHLFSTYDESDFNFVSDSNSDLGGEQSPSLLDKVKSMFSKQDDAIAKQSQEVQGIFADVHAAVEMGLAELHSQIAEKDGVLSAQQQQLDDLRKDFTALKETLDTTPDTTDYSERSPATGGASIALTDC